MTVEKKSVLVVEDHPILRSGLIQVINNEPDLCVTGEADDVQSTLSALGNQVPDMAMIDISLKGGNGIELIREIKSKWGDLPMLVLSMHDESLFAERAINAGARGYITKSESTDKILEAIRTVIRGDYYVSPQMISKVFGRMYDHKKKIKKSPLEQLSDRELEVLELTGQGKNTRQIAERLFLSMKTIQTYQQRLKDKLSLENATALIQYATQWVNRDT